MPAVTSRTVFYCNNCAEYGEEPTERRAYDVDEIVAQVRQRQWWLGDDWSELAPQLIDDLVPETVLCCPNCEQLVEQKEACHATVWVCPRCSNWFDVDDYSSHDALVCCVECTGKPDDGCLDGCDLGTQETVLSCHCDPYCDLWICRFCHYRDDDYGDVDGHIEENHSGEALPEPAPVCEICASDWCCLIHGRHQNPHVACDVA